MLTEGLAPGIGERLSRWGVASKDVCCCFAADLDLDGRASPQWAIVTRRELIVVSQDAPAGETHRTSRFQARGFRIDPGVGSIFLQVDTDGQWRDAVRCSNAHREELAQFAERLDQWLNDNQPPIDDGPEAATHETKHAVAIPLRRRLGGWSQSNPEHRRTLVRIWGLIREHRWSALLLAGLSIAAVAIELAPPILQKILVDDVLRIDGQGDPAERGDLLTLLLAVVAGLLFFRVMAAVLAIWKGRVAGQVGASLTADLRTRLVRKLHELPVAYHDRNQVGMLMSRVAYDTEVMHTLVHQTSSGFILQVLQLFGIGVMLFWLNPKLALFTMLPMPLVIVASWYFSRYLHPRHHHYWEAVGKQAAALAGMLSGIRVVKSFTQEEREFERFRESSERLRAARQGVDISTSTFSALMAFLFGLGGLIVWYVGGRDVLGDRMTLGSLMAFLAFLAMFYTPLTSLAESTTWISNFLTASQRIFELIDTPNDVDDPDPASRPEPFRGGIRFEHVTFGYGDGEPVLKDVDFEVRPGEMIGLVGRSGSGKSTLVSLIGRMYDPKSGRIVVDDVDLRGMQRADLRRRVGIVLQDPFLFRGSLAANIAYGHPEAPSEQLIRAAKSAAAHEFIMRSPFAYDSQVGEGGKGLSGGERQRISIARALLYDPRILILDEATSSVDTESEQAIQEALRDFARGRTTIAIAHRLSTLRDADRLLVFDRGRLVEQGTHDELLASGGVYSSLVNIQTNLRRGVRQLQEAGSFVGPAGDEAIGIASEDVGGDAVLFEGDAADEPPNEARSKFQPRWLEPTVAEIRWDDAVGLCLEEDGNVDDHLHALYAFPASHPEEFISLRRRDPLGGDEEVGLIRVLADWPEAARAALRRSLDRRYLLRRIESIQGLRTAGDRLEFHVETDSGPTTFRIDPRGDGLQPYGRNGRLLVDVQQNFYVIPDLGALPRRQRQLLSLYLGT
ncbi:MAG: DUF1854 domain-containing protein [Planctomycetaceae bacterium]